MPTFFATLSSADLKWNGIFSIIGKLHKLDILEENIKNRRRIPSSCLTVGVCRKKKREKPELHELVKMYQLHRHSKICKKYNNEVVELNLKSFSIMKH